MSRGAASYYQTENFDEVIGAMVEHGVAWTPTVAKWLRPPFAQRRAFQERENEILNDPNADLPAAVRTVTDNAYDKLLKRYAPEQLTRAKIGYEKANEFIRRVVEAGVSPMTAIQAGTSALTVKPLPGAGAHAIKISVIPNGAGA